MATESASPKHTNALPMLGAIEPRDPAKLKPDPDNPRKHTRRQLTALERVIKAHGFLNPILIDEHDNILAGHGRQQAALNAGLSEVPCYVARHLTEEQKQLVKLADNKIGDLSSFDTGLVIKKLETLSSADIDIELSGFLTGELDVLFTPPGPSQSGGNDPIDNIVLPDRTLAPVTQPDDSWRLGDHTLRCGNALSAGTYQMLLGEKRAALVIADSPFNTPIPGHVSGLGRMEHPNFAMASGEMSPKEHVTFQRTFMTHLVGFSVDGSLHYIFIDWPHVREILAASDGVYSEQKALLVWNKTNGGMGSFYRSKHELIFVFKNGTAPHVNNIDLGKHGRYRTNVLDYPGANAFGPTRAQDLADHPTVKPVALIADLIRDASKRKALVLDPFAGSGTMLLAAERTGRRAAAIELDPHYCDVAIRRWQAMTGGKAVRAADGRTFDDLVSERDAGISGGAA